MRKRRLLDLFCGAGGASMGYARAGFDVTGVDISPQPRYPFTLIRDDAVEYLERRGGDYDVIHASPPCQRYSICTRITGVNKEDYPDLVEHVIRLLDKTGRHWVVENVIGAPIKGIVLCGTMFGLPLYRHRIFESSVMLLAPPHPTHKVVIKAPGKTHLLRGGNRTPGKFTTVVGSMFSLASGSVSMGIDWMTIPELAEAIPPAYTEYIGRQLLLAVDGSPFVSPQSGGIQYATKR